MDGLEVKPHMRLCKKVLLVILSLLLIGCLLMAAFFYGLRRGGEEAEPVITSAMLGEQLCSAQELTTVAYYYTNMGRFENQVDFYGWKVPFTLKSFIVSYDGVIKAGVDLTRIEVEIDDLAKTVTVRLPEQRNK